MVKKFKIGKFPLSLLLLLMVVALAGCNASETSKNKGNVTEQGKEQSQDKIKLSLGHIAAEHRPWNVAAESVGEELKDKTNNRVTIELFPQAVLGGERDMLEQVQTGSLDIMVSSIGPVSNFVDEYNVLDMPFLFEDIEHARKVLQPGNEVWDILSNASEEAGFKLLGFWEQGFRVISNTVRPVKNVEDLNNTKMRVQESSMLVDLYRNFGSDATPISYPEVYTALQTGVIEGFEGSLGGYGNIKLWDVTDYMSRPNMQYMSSVILMNKSKFDSLNSEDQETLVELFVHYTEIHDNELNVQADEKIWQEVIDAGVEVIEYEEMDIESFHKAVQPLYEKYGQYEDLVNKVKDLK